MSSRGPTWPPPAGPRAGFSDRERAPYRGGRPPRRICLHHPSNIFVGDRVRRLFALLTVAACAALVLPSFARAADPTPAPKGCAGVFCAGAARGDITPPVTTPMWGYTAREVGDHSPDILQNSADKLAAGDPASALTTLADDPAVADKRNGDTEGYCKTFECNQGIQIRLYA